MLMFEQPFLAFQSSTVADKPAIGPDDPVAGYDERPGVSCQGHAHGPGRFGTVTHEAGDLAITFLAAGGDGTYLLKNRLLEIADLRPIQRDIGEILRMPFEVQLHLFNQSAHPVGSWRVI